MDNKELMESKLSRHSCYLVQRGFFIEPENEITGRSSIINLDYMGSSEFEWGALPRSTRRMLTNIEFYDVFEYPEYTNPKGEVLMVYAPVMFIEHISKIVRDLVQDNLYLKEYCDLSEYMKGSKWARSDFWWDIENDFYIFFGEEHRDLILKAQKKMRERSIDKVPVGDWDQLSIHYSIANPDLDDKAKEFLRPKKKKLVKRMIKAINTKIETEKSKQTN